MRSARRWHSFGRAAVPAGDEEHAMTEETMSDPDGSQPATTTRSSDLLVRSRRIVP